MIGEGNRIARLYGAIEAGGTKINLAVGSSPTQLVATHRFDTTAPVATMEHILRFFDTNRVDLVAFGVASFGPVRLDRSAPDWGRLLNTPKPGWASASFVQPLIEAFSVPVELETDVGAAALAEYRLGALQGMNCGVYMTVGTGIGGGIVVNGSPIRGSLHPELGHMRVLRGLGDEGYRGCCPYHGDCLEGLASGPAIKQRWGAPLNELAPDHPAHALVADYLGQACATLVLNVSADRIVIGGGVSKALGIHQAVAVRMRHWLGGYIDGPATSDPDFVVPPGLADRSGIVGALLIAQAAACSAD